MSEEQLNPTHISALDRAVFTEGALTAQTLGTKVMTPSCGFVEDFARSGNLKPLLTAGMTFHGGQRY
jgi:hypothetical protein